MARTYLYILSNNLKTNLLVDITANLLARVYYLRTYGTPTTLRQPKPKRLVYYEEYRDRDAAKKRLKEVSRLSESELATMIETLNPKWHDLWPQVSESYHFDETGIKVDKVKRVMTKRFYEFTGTPKFRQ